MVSTDDASALAQMLASYVFLSEDADWRSTALARYAANTKAALARQDAGAISAGEIAFPDAAPNKEDV